MDTLFLSQKLGPDGSPAWDLALDTASNIARASGPYAIAQDVASAVRVFLGEMWYDTTQGVPYFQQILGQLPSYQFMKAQIVATALTVPAVASVKCFLTGPGPAREVGGQIQITDDDGFPAPLVVTTSQMGVAPWYIKAVNTYAL